MPTNEAPYIPPRRRPVVEVVDEIMVPILRSKTEAERFEMAAQMWRFARDTYVALARAQHPDWTPEQLQREAARRLAGEG
jgi:hypothetical protein